jgi:hypothetical protein
MDMDSGGVLAEPGAFTPKPTHPEHHTRLGQNKEYVDIMSINN